MVCLVSKILGELVFSSGYPFLVLREEQKDHQFKGVPPQPVTGFLAGQIHTFLAECCESLFRMRAQAHIWAGLFLEYPSFGREGTPKEKPTFWGVP